MREIITKLGSFTLLRAVALFLTVLVAIYLTVLIANWGGALDTTKINQIKFEQTIRIYGAPEYQGVPESLIRGLIDDAIEREIRRQGLDKPFIERSVRYTLNAVTLNLGRSEKLISDRSSRQVRNILLDRLPSTLILIATAELLLFFISLGVALFLSRRYGSFLDRLIVALAPTSAAPAWFYGLFLILIFAAILRVLPWGNMVATPPPPTTGAYALSMMKHMILPVSAVLIGAVFSSIYSWRTFFLIYSSEDYVELARAKGLSSSMLERRYILRPTLPPILTSFVLMLITVWMGAIILETVFQWPGIGRLFYQALALSDTPVIVGVVVIFGYLLAGTVFLLDFAYAALDPRVRLGAAGGRR